MVFTNKFVFELFRLSSHLLLAKEKEVTSYVQRSLPEVNGFTVLAKTKYYTASQ